MRARSVRFCGYPLSNAAGPPDHELIIFGSFTLPLLATCEKLGFGGCKLTSCYTSEALTWGKRKSSVLIPCITTLADVMMNGLLTCVVSKNKCEDGAGADRGSYMWQMLGGNSDGWIHSNQPFSYRPTRSPPGAFRFYSLHDGQSLSDLLWVKASFDKLKATSHESSVV